MICWYCHGTMEQTIVNVKKYGRLLAIPGWKCPTCGEIVFEASVLAEIEEQYRKET